MGGTQAIVNLDNGDGTYTVASYNTSVASELKLNAVNIALSGEVKLMFYFKGMEYFESHPQAYLEVSIPAKEDGSYKVIGRYQCGGSGFSADGKGRYVINVSVPYAQQADKVRLQVVDGEERGKLRQYSVKDYGDIIIEGANGGKTEYAAFAAPVKAMLNTGAMSQSVMQYNEDFLANEGIYYSGNPIDAVDKVKDEAPATPTNNGITAVTTTAILEGTARLRIYFNYEGSGTLTATVSRTYNGYKESNVTVHKYNGNAITVGGLNATHYVQINNISAAMYDVAYEVVVTDGESSCTIERSMIDYIYNVLSSEAQTNVKNVAKSMYQYYVSVKAFIDKTDISTGCAHTTTHQEIKVKPTCDTAGTSATVCSLCNTEIATGEISALGHKLVLQPAVAATCTKVGTIAHKSCSVCGKLYNEAGDTELTSADITAGVATEAHNYGDKYGFANVNGEYKWVKYCLDCGQFSSNEADAKSALKVELSVADYVALNEEVVVDINIIGNPGFKSLNLTVTPGKSVNLAGIESKANGVNATANSADGSITIAISSESAYTSTGTVAQLKLNATTLGKIDFTVVVTDGVDGADASIDTNYVLASANSVTITKAECAHTNVIYNVKTYNHDVICENCGAVLEKFVQHNSNVENYVDNGNIRTYTGACDCGKERYSYELNLGDNKPSLVITGAELLKKANGSGANNLGNVVLSGDGTYVSFYPNTGSTSEGFFDVFKGSTNNASNAVTGQYMLIKYRTERNKHWQFFGNAGINANGPLEKANFYVDRSYILSNCGWNTIIIDLDNMLGDYYVKTEGDEGYRLAYLRWDIFDNGNGVDTDKPVDVAYIAFADNIKALGDLNPYNGSTVLTNTIGTPYNSKVENIYFGPAYIASKIGIAEYAEDNTTGIPYAHITANKAEEIYTHLWSNDKNPLTLGVGEYISVVYRKPASDNPDTIEFWMNSNQPGATGKGDHIAAYYMIRDGEWHILVYNTYNIKDQNKEAWFDPKVGISSLRFDMFNQNFAVGSTLDVAYIGVFDTVEETYSYFVDYMKSYCGDTAFNNCAHENNWVENTWEFIDGSNGTDVVPAKEYRTCVLCGEKVGRDAVVAFCFDNVYGNSNGEDHAVIASSLNNNNPEYNRKFRPFANNLRIKSDGTLPVEGWAGINGLFSDKVKYRIIGSNGTELLTWTDLTINRGNALSSDDGVVAQVKSQIPDVNSDPRRFNFTISGLNEFVKCNEAIQIELAFVPEGFDNNIIRFAAFTAVYKPHTADDAAKWTPVIVGGGSTTLQEEKKCTVCGNQAQVRNVAYANSVDHLIFNGKQYRNIAAAAAEINEAKKSVTSKVGINGWFACNGGVEKYVYRINVDGEWSAWQDAAVNLGNISADSAIDNAIKGANIGIADYYTNGNIGHLRTESLQDYVGKTIQVQFGAVPKNNTGAAGNVNAIIIYTIGDINIVCDHIKNTNAYTVIPENPIKESATCSVCNGNLTRYIVATDEGLKIATPEYLVGKTVESATTSLLVDDVTGMTYAHFEITETFTAEHCLYVWSGSQIEKENVGGYVAFLYRANKGTMGTEMFISKNGTLDGTHWHSVSVTGDGKWRLAVVKARTDYYNITETGVEILRLDLFNTNGAGYAVGDYCDIAYLAFFSSEQAAYDYYAKFVTSYQNGQEWCIHKTDYNWAQAANQPGVLAQHCKYCNKEFNTMPCQHYDESKLTIKAEINNDGVYDYTADCTLCGATDVSVDIKTPDEKQFYNPGRLMYLASQDSRMRDHTSFIVTKDENNNMPYIHYQLKSPGVEAYCELNSGTTTLENVGKFFAVMYRTDNNPNMQLYFSNAGVTGSANAQSPSVTFVKDGNWNLALFDLSKHCTIDTSKGLGWSRFDIFNANDGTSIDVAYMGFFGSRESAAEYYSAYLTKFAGSTNTHSHVAKTIWKRADGQSVYTFNSICAVCGNVIETKSGVNQLGLKQWMPADLSPLECSKELTKTTMNDSDFNNMPYLRVAAPNGTTGEAFFYLNSTTNRIYNVGKYVVVLYRSNGVSANEIFISPNGGVAGGQSVNCGSTNSTNWALATFDFSAKTIWDASTGINQIRWDIFNGAHAAGKYIDIAYVGMFNSTAEANDYFDMFAKAYGLRYTVNFDAENCKSDTNALFDVYKRSNDKAIEIDCSDATLTSAKSIKLGGWFVTYGGVESYKYRVVSEDGVAVESPAFKDWLSNLKTIEETNGIYKYFGVNYDDGSRQGAGFQGQNVIDLTGCEGKTVNIEIVAFTNHGAEIVIAKLNNIKVPDTQNETETETGTETGNETGTGTGTETETGTGAETGNGTEQ